VIRAIGLNVGRFLVDNGRMRRLPAALASVALLAGLVGLAAPAQAARAVSGTIQGSDGRALDVFIGFDLKNSSGQTIDKNGCLATKCGLHGYGITLRLNGNVGAEGATDRTAYKTAWTVTVPSNTARMFIEVYPFSSGTYGHTDESRYGHSYRRNIAIPYPTRINLRLPQICSTGGTTGAITGRATVGGRATALKRVGAWSLATDNNGPTPILGWTIGTTASDGTFSLPNLAAGQKYQVMATAPNGTVKRYYDVQVNSCRSTNLGVSF
jgi:hypothetical protein